MALLLSFPILADTSPQPFFCPALIVFVHQHHSWVLCSVLWPSPLCLIAVKQLLTNGKGEWGKLIFIHMTEVL